MRNQAFLLAACAAVVIGCGGGGHHSSSSTSTSGSNTTGGMTVNLSNPTVGSVDVTYLTGEGRAVGDLYLEITRQTIGTTADALGRTDSTPLRLSLASNSTIQTRINVPFTLTTSGYADSRLFSTVAFDPSRFVVQTSSSPAVFGDGPALPSNLPFTADARVRVLPGRTTTLQINVAPSEFPADSSGNRTFDSTQFTGLNYSSDTTDSDGYGKLSSRLSDFVRFPLANLRNPATGELDQTMHPDLRTGYLAGDVTTNGAEYVYFSGDNIALSNAVGGSGSVFQELSNAFSDDPTDPAGSTLIGLWSGASSGGFQGTYDLRDLLPQSIDTDVPANRLVSVYGGFRDYNEVLSGGSSFEIIMFPNSGESYAQIDTGGSTTGRTGDIVALVRTNGLITNMYFGGVDLRAGTFELFPIKYLGSNPATFADSLTGTVNNYRNANNSITSNYASIRKFSFSFDSAPTVSGITQTGTVTVFRR